MSYIGSSPASQAFAPGTDTFSGTGSQVAFTLSRNVATVNDILVVVNNVDQQPTAYTVASNTLTFSAAPSSGTNNIYVRYLSTNLVTIAPGQGTVGANQLVPGTLTPAAVSDQLNTSTGYFDLPAGTTAQRPSTAVGGYTRFNTTTGYMEYYDGAAWFNVNQTRTIAASYLIVAGGAGGGYGYAGVPGGGGGAGGMLTGTSNLTPGTVYSVTVGGGGAGGASNGAAGAAGSASVFNALTASGGGSGGSGPSYGPANGGAGGSGGGGMGPGSGTSSGGAGTSGQGNNGGNSGPGGSGGSGAGGGGGKGAVGGTGSGLGAGAIGGAGGAGASSSITGTATNYAGGGGGGGTGSPGVGGAGGGGAGSASGVATAGTVNTGGGGGGGYSGGGAGGSGVVILSVPTIFYSGITTGSPTVTTSGSNTVIKFTASGSYTA